MTRKIAPWLVLGIFLISTLASAQTSPGRQGAFRDRLRENLNHLRLLRMTEALDLTEEQTAKIYPVAARIEKEKAEIIRELRAKMQELRDFVSKADAKDQDLAARVKAIRQLRLGLQQKDREFEDFLEANLTEIQAAKYVIFLADFNRTIGDKLNRARALRRNRERY
jgi:Spy/CpxP family protein refolding chaperone